MKFVDKMSSKMILLGQTRDVKNRLYLCTKCKFKGNSYICFTKTSNKEGSFPNVTKCSDFIQKQDNFS